MTDRQLQSLLTGANPLTAEHARELPVDQAQDDLLAGLMDEWAPARAAGRVSRVRRRRRVFALAVATTAVALLALLSLRDDSAKPGSGTAWAAAQVRFAEASPLVLLGAPGWRVEYGDEQSEQEGELHFQHGPATQAPSGASAATLHWRGGGLGSWLRDRGASAARTTTAPVLGTTAHVYQYEGGRPGHRDITALFRYDGRVLEFRAGAANLDAFKVLLAALKGVDTDTWLSAMPASVVKTSDREVTVNQMLQGVAVPPGFDPNDIKGAELTKDHYQLGAAVTGTVACQWFKRWSDAREAGDRAKEREAIAAMATAKGWPILKEMAKEGAYPDVLMEFAAHMPSGGWYGRPLTGDVNSGLGCDSLGVDLP